MDYYQIKYSSFLSNNDFSKKFPYEQFQKMESSALQNCYKMHTIVNQKGRHIIRKPGTFEKENDYYWYIYIPIVTGNTDEQKNIIKDFINTIEEESSYNIFNIYRLIYQVYASIPDIVKKNDSKMNLNFKTILDCINEIYLS